MKSKQMTQVALRYRAIFLDIEREAIDMASTPTVPVMAFVARLSEKGFSVNEELLHALNTVPAERLAEIVDCIKEVMGVELNWAPLVKGWNVPTGETIADHFITIFANLLDKDSGIKGTTLPCGHLIPEGTFPLERYNGCPFCGTPFQAANYVYEGQGSKKKELRLFTRDDLQQVFHSLLASSTPLDATQRLTLEQLLMEYPIPSDIKIQMKENLMIVIRHLIRTGNEEAAQDLMKTPTDVLRYLWYEKTGYVQIIEPKTFVQNARRLYYHLWSPLDKGAEASAAMKKRLRLKYDRKSCQRVARWLNNLPMSAAQAAENMNPKRGMWVRMIRALRLGEYSRKRGFENLAALLDVFYHNDYPTFQGKIDKSRTSNDADTMLALLKQRPGLFARCLFSTMLRFGKDKVTASFNEVSDLMPARLLLSLGNAAENYFDPHAERLARPLTGLTHLLGPNKLVALYSPDELESMKDAVLDIYRTSMSRRFANQPTTSKTIYIEPSLHNIPVSVGDRSTSIQDTSCALMGTRFPVEGDAVRLFMQWGKGLHAQYLDMDLSARIGMENGSEEECAYYNLTCHGAKHSGDIRSIPELVGTAEYIELSLPELEAAHARYVTFTCNAYSQGALSPNLVVGWMDSAYEMKLSEADGVAYDPSCVQHMVRISEGNLSKGLVFGVLDVRKREIIWLEMPFSGQNLHSLSTQSVEALLRRLNGKVSIGELLTLKAESQGLAIVETADTADESYTYEWALNPADVTKLLNL